jgi:signal transduction histidine kinase
VPDGGLLLIAEDRTEQLRLSAVRDTLLRTRTATFDSLFESVAVFAPDGRMQLWNRRFCRRLGARRRVPRYHPHIEDLLETIGARLSKPARPSVGDAVRAATLDRKQTRRPCWLDRWAHPRICGRTAARWQRPADGARHHRQPEGRRSPARTQRRALVEADAVKTRFLANMSYEFRTPLTSIGGFAELLQAGLGGELSDQGRRRLRRCDPDLGRKAGRADREPARPVAKRGRDAATRERRDRSAPVPVTQTGRGARRNALRDAGLTLDLRGDKASRAITGDRRRLGRAIGHLLDNAIAATPSGGRILVMLTREQHKDAPGRGSSSPTMVRAWMRRRIGARAGGAQG